MSLQIKQYTTQPERVEAIKLTQENIQQAAKWCGGKVVEQTKPSDPTDSHTELHVPHLAGILQMQIGQYLTRSDDGRFSTYEADIFETKFKQLGLRQDGPIPRKRATK